MKYITFRKRLRSLISAVTFFVNFANPSHVFLQLNRSMTSERPQRIKGDYSNCELVDVPRICCVGRVFQHKKRDYSRIIWKRNLVSCYSWCYLSRILSVTITNTWPIHTLCGIKKMHALCSTLDYVFCHINNKSKNSKHKVHRYII